jgi:hypothetical protein
MAIISWLAGVSVQVHGPTGALTEYQTKTSPPADSLDAVAARLAGKTVTWYIEVTDAEFTIPLHVDNTYNFNHSKLSFEIYLDGRMVAEVHVEGPMYKRQDNNWEYEVTGLEQKLSSRNHTVMPFRFKEIEKSR